MDRFAISMPAKINLGLDVVKRRKDDYHEVRMVMQSVALFDEVWLEKSGEPGITIQTDMPQLPTGRRNLAYRAAELFMERYGIEEGVSIRIAKKIPVAAGLAGGSADAAAVIMALNRLFETHAAEKQLRDLALLIGADVPFCICRGTALAEGVGEKLMKLPPMPDCAILIAKPPYSISTRDAYEAFDVLDEPYHPSLDALLDAVKARNLEKIASSMGNSLEAAVLPKHSDLREMLELFLEMGALGSGMSGSGPSVFGIFRDRDIAEKAQMELRRRFAICQTILTKPYQPEKEAEKSF